VAGGSLSPGLRRMVDRVGSQEPFGQGSRDLAELAGLNLTSKRVQRSAEADGEVIREAIAVEAGAVLSGKVVPLVSSDPVSNLYVAIDGTGVPTVPADTEGRQGKSPDGQAHTREAKLGCLFTQTTVDDTGRPIRDPHSSSYVATMTVAGDFGHVLYAEAQRRGCDRAQRLIVLGDGAPWIWNLASEHFPRAIQIVDLYHTREHLYALTRLAFPVTTEESRRWLANRLGELDCGEVEKLLAAARRLRLSDPQMEEIDKALGYFQTNLLRMRYARFREMGLFVGSGAVEAGCRAVVAQRMKLSGMRWSVRGAAAIISLRCQEASDRWEEIWQWLPYQTGVA